MIPLTVPEVTKSLQRILVFFYPEPKEQLAYIRAIHEVVSIRCTAELFDRACQIVAEKMKPGKKPVPSEFLEVIQGIKALQHKVDYSCDSCKGSKMIPGRVYSELYDKTVEAMIPCPDCQPSLNDQPPPAPDEKTRAAGGD